MNCIEICKKFPNEKDAKKSLPFLFNLTLIKETTHNYDFFHVHLKQSNYKGLGLFASKKIPANRTLLYYKLKVYQRNKYMLYNGGEYSFIVYKNKCQKDFDKVADIYDDSNPKPKARKPFWGYLVNEPSENQRQNMEIFQENEKKAYSEGDIIIYYLKTTREIEQDEELTWCYGNSYTRDYKTSCQNK